MIEESSRSRAEARFTPILVCLLCLVCGCGGSDDPSLTGPLSFAWPAPATVRVTEKVLKSGGEAEFSYFLDIIPDGNFLNITYRDMELVRLPGADLEDPEVRASLEAQMALDRTIRIGRSGRLVEVVGLAETVEQMLRDFEKAEPAGTESTPEEREQRAARVAAAIKLEVAQVWGCWVQRWIDAPGLAAGNDVKLNQKTPAPDGTLISGHGECRHLGPAEEAAGHVRLSATIEADPEQLRAAQARVMSAMLADAGPDEASEINPEIIEEARLVMTADVVTRPSTLQPRRARFEKTVTTRARGVQPIETVERHEYTFDWDGP